MPAPVSFGQFVKKHRLAIGLTQVELSGRVGCATITLRRIEADSLRPSVQIAERLAMALDIPLEERTNFVRLARTALLGTPEPPAVPAPTPEPEEIGGEDLTGRAVRGYELGERIGSGGFGAVYRAVQPGVEREVALKIILPQYANHPDFVRRFEAEAHLVARLEHPYIVPLYDFWREPNAAYLVMRLLRGGSLRHLLENGPLPLDFFWQVLNQIGRGLHAAHRFGIIHRDLKPDNILLDEDKNAYLADFGIAKNLGNPDPRTMTSAGDLIGSPAYMSPEQIRSEAVRPQADIYCLGIMLFEMLTGMLPFPGPTPVDQIMHHLNQPLPSLQELVPDLPSQLGAIIQKATEKDPQARYQSIPELLEAVRISFSQRVEGQVWEVAGLPDLQVVDPAVIDNPFKGLRAFTEADAEHFYGRNALVQSLLGRIGQENDTSRFLAVVGPSGSGKSSVVKAGFIPAVRRGALPGSEHWFVVDFMPGRHPFEELEAALLRVAVNPPESLLQQIQEDERGLIRAVKRILPTDEHVELLMVIDQFEEIFSAVDDERVRTQFLDSIVTAVLEPRSRIRIVITMRADFTDRPLGYVDFGEMVRQQTEFVLPLTPDELEQAITGPVRGSGLVMEPALLARMMRELGDQPGTLPLLQYALTELFERRDGLRLTMEAYQEIGGVLGALGQRAEEIFSGLDETRKQATRQLFLRLVTLGEGVEDTRRRVLLEEVMSLQEDPGFQPEPGGGDGEIKRVLDQYGSARLLTFDHDPATRLPTVEVAHEAILREWERLRGWLNDSRADIRLQRQLGRAAEEWAAAEKDPSFLLRGARLAQFETWTRETGLRLTPAEEGYLEASLAAREARQVQEAARLEREERLELRSRNFLRALVGVFAVAALIAILLSVIANNQRLIALGEADGRATQQVIAEEQALIAEQQADLAATSAAEAQAEALARATQQAIAEEQQAIADQQRLIAEGQARLATSRELAQSAVLNLSVDPQLSVLLAYMALETEHTRGAVEALHQSVQASRLRLTLPGITAAFSPDGSRLAIGGADGTIWIRDGITGEELHQWNGHSALVNQVAFSPSGALLASGSEDGIARIWDPSSGQELLTLLGHSLDFGKILFSPDGRLVATASLDDTVRLWDISAKLQDGADTMEAFLKLDVPGSSGSSIIFTPDGNYFITSGSDFQIKIWNAETAELEQSHPGGRDLAISPDGSLLAMAMEEIGVIEVWDLKATLESGTAQVVHTLRDDPLFLRLAFGPNGTLLASTGIDGRTRLWDLASADGENPISLFPSGANLDFNAAGTRLVTSNRGVQVWDVSPGGEQELGHLLGDGHRTRWLSYSPDGDRLAIASWGGARVLEVHSGQELMKLAHHAGPIWTIEFSPDGSRIATGGADNTARILDAQNGQELALLAGHKEAPPVGGIFPGIVQTTFSPDGELVATAAADGMVKVWEADSGEELMSLQVHDQAGVGAANVAFSPDGKKLAATTDFTRDNVGRPMARVWDLATRETLFSVEIPARGWGLAFSPDGAHLVTSGSGGFLIIWDAESGEHLSSLTGFSGTVGRVMFSSDGQYLLTEDGISPKVWDFESRTKLWDLPFPGRTQDAAFSPDGKHVAIAGTFGEVRLYTLDLEELKAIALSRITRWFSLDECERYLHTATCPPAPGDAGP